MQKSRTEFSRTQMIMIGFIIIIIIGSLLLMLPISSKEGTPTQFLNAFFTATSATCVTGLVVYDTFAHWSVFGQLVILTMIQIGGLGFITFGVYGLTLLRKKIGLRNRELIHDSLNSMHVGGGVRLVKKIVIGTLLFETLGAALLSIRFIPQMGFVNGVYFSIFHSVSAFCNAGFDLMGGSGEFCSLTSYSDDILVNLVIMTLIIIGGIGFIVWDDIYHNKFNFKKYMLHTKVVVTVTAILIFGGAVFFYFSENNGIFSDISIKERILSSLFLSVSPRTAGFNTVDIASLSGAGKIVTIILMFIGGSSGSTAGGIKTTAVAAIAFFIISYIKKEKGHTAFNRSLDDNIIKKASTVFFINLFLALSAMIIILLSNQNFNISDVAFEAFSAIGTVGMTTGITRDLSIISKISIILLMYFGRVGSLSFALSFTERRKVPDIRYPKENIIIG